MSKLRFSIFLISGIAAMSFALDPIWDAVSRAFKDGNADAVSNYMDSSVDINILGEETTLAKAQAVQSLKNFFSKNKAKGFTQIHTGSSKAKESCYYIGELDSTSGKYRVYIYFKGSGTAQLIKEIRIDKV
ncbi:MAG TPA: DUF4783 domain-containing protein [Saprospiraceae bacterium]|nr:DUF4783 domain-containing protein [Saprospiraceae bacterium]